MFKLSLIISILVIVSVVGCGPSQLAQTVAEGEQKLKERQERERMELEIKSEAAEKRWQQTLAEIKRKQAADAKQAQLQAEYDYHLSLLDAENRQREIENDLRKVEITSERDLRKVEITSERDLRKVEITSEKEIRIAQMQAQALIQQRQIEAYEKLITGRMNAEANLEEARLLLKVGVEQAKMQALIGAVQMRLKIQNKSEEIEAIKQIQIAKNHASVEIAKFEAPTKAAEVEANAAIQIVDRISRAKTEQELIKYAATVALFSEEVPETQPPAQ